MLLSYVCRSLRASSSPALPRALGSRAASFAALSAPLLHPTPLTPRLSPLAGSKLFRTLAAASTLDDRVAPSDLHLRSAPGRLPSASGTAGRRPLTGARMASTQGVPLRSNFPFEHVAVCRSTLCIFLHPFQSSISLGSSSSRLPSAVLHSFPASFHMLVRGI